MVPAIPAESGQDVAVFVVHVESVKKVWVCREDEVRVSLLMDKLARLGEELKPAPRMKKGAVYGARFSQDGELYRVVLKEAVEGKVVVQFIDFGNKETKEEKELYDIPEEIGIEPAAAFEVSVKNNFEETDGNREEVEELLDGGSLTVAVTEVGVVFKINGEEVVFNQADANTSNITTASEEMVTMKDMEQSSPPTQKQSVVVNHVVPVVASSSEVLVPQASSSEVLVPQASSSDVLVPQASSSDVLVPQVYSSEVPATSANYEAPTVAAIPEVSPQTRATLLPAAIPVATVPIPAPSVPQPVPTRTFAKAISALQSQLLARPRTSTGGSKEETVKTREIVCPWSAGDKVVARWSDGVWRQAMVSKVEKGGKVNVVCEGLEEVMVDLINVRPHSLPVEALNLIDQGLINSTVVRQKGDGASNEKKGVTPTVVGKVKEWMDKNMNQLTLGGGGSLTELEVEDSMSPPLEATSKQSLEQAPLPPSQDLPGYSRTSKGSLHIQSILNSANHQLSNHVLSSLLTGSPGPLSLMTSPKSSYVIQKLITVTASPQLQPLLTIILSHFTQLSLDSSGCRVVQSMLEFSSPDQQRSITSLLCNTKTILTLASDRHGTYVAQACLPHLTPIPTALLALVTSVQGYTAMLGQHQCGTFFLQRLVGVLSTHYSGSGAACMLQEDILASLSQLGHYRAGEQQIVARLDEEGSWSSLLER